MFEGLERAYRTFETCVNDYVRDFKNKKRRSDNSGQVILSLNVIKKIFDSEGWGCEDITHLINLIEDTKNYPSLDNTTIKRIDTFVRNIKKKIDEGR